MLMRSRGFLSVWIGLTFTAQASGAELESRSVYQVDPVVDGSIIGATSLATLIPYLKSDQWIRPRCPCDPNEVGRLDRGAIGNSNVFLDVTSDVTLVLAVATPVVADWADLGWSRELREDLVVFAEVMSVNGAFVTLAKYTFQRPLPRTYAGDPKLLRQPGGYRSFYSGHASVTFSALSAASVTLNLRYDAGIWPWLVTAGVGGSVAAERVAAGRHFFTDVAAGAVAGIAVGTLIPLLHRRDDSAETSSIRFVPVHDGGLIAWTRFF